MPFLILLAFIGVPLLEIAVFIQVGGAFGLGWTLALVVLTAVLGTALLRAQGMATLNRAKANLERGEVPMREVFDGACLLVGGALLLTPGFVTDTMGFLLLLPPVRAALLAWVSRNGRLQVHATRMGGGAGPDMRGMGGDMGDPRGGGGTGPVIDVDYEDVGPPRPTRWSGLGHVPSEEDKPDDR